MKKLILVLVILTISVFAQETNRYVEVTGKSEIKVKADQIFIRIELKSVKENMDQSNFANKSKLDLLNEILDEFTIASKDIEQEPIYFGVEYNYKNGEREFVGYYSQQHISVTLNKLDKYFDLLKRLSETNNFEIVNSSYSNSEYLKYRKQALKEAVLIAKSKAENIANILDISTGKVLEVEEHNESQNRLVQLNSVSALNKSNTFNASISVACSVRLKIELVE